MKNLLGSTDRLLKKFDKQINEPGVLNVNSVIICGYVEKESGNITIVWSEELLGYEILYNTEFDDLSYFKYTLFITEEESNYYKELMNQFSVKMEDYNEDDRIEVYLDYSEKIIAPVVKKLEEGLRQEIIKFGQKIIPFPMNKIK